VLLKNVDHWHWKSQGLLLPHGVAAKIVARVQVKDPGLRGWRFPSLASTAWVQATACATASAKQETPSSREIQGRCIAASYPGANNVLKIATLQCFYIDQWLRWASGGGCLGRTPARSLILATDLYKNTVVLLNSTFLRLGTRLGVSRIKIKSSNSSQVNFLAYYGSTNQSTLTH
jgi:hypothetical protein